MKQKVAFESALRITPIEVKKAASEQYPNLKLDGLETLEDLQSYFAALELVVYVDIDNDVQYDEAIAKEQKLADRIEEMIGEDSHLVCEDEEPPAPEFTEEDLNNMHLCQIDSEQDLLDDNIKAEVELELEDLETEIKKILKAQHGSLEGDPDSVDEISKIQDCLSEMQTITDNINRLNEREVLVKQTYTRLEELWWNFRIMSRYFEKRNEILSFTLGTFDPLIEERRKEEAELRRLEALLETEEDDKMDKVLDLGFDPTGTITLPPPPGSSGASGASGSSGNSGGITGFAYNMLNEEQKGLWDSIVAVHAQIVQTKADIVATEERIDIIDGKIMDKRALNSIFKDDPLYIGTELDRKIALEARFSSLFGTTAYNAVSAFSSRTDIRPRNDITEESTFGQSIDLEFTHDFLDPLNLLQGRPRLYRTSDSFLRYTPTTGATPGGVLYTRLYNIWGDIDLFFTREERGLTTDSNLMAPELSGTGVGPVNGNFISKLSIYEDFYQNFADHHKAKVKLVKDTVLEPALSVLLQTLEDVATKEVLYLLTYGKVFEFLPAESTRLQNAIANLQLSSGKFKQKMDSLESDLEFLRLEHQRVLDDIKKERQKYSTVTCAAGPIADPNDFDPDKNPPGNDPLGAESLKANDPKNPNPTKHCYWVKFAKCVTAVNLLPLPGSGGFRYWPIGFVIPNPSGITKIPLPIIWIPLAVIPLPVGIFVIFIGQCGICPSPFVLYIGPNFEKKFIISLRPCQEFGTDASKGILKTLEKGGIAINKPIMDMIGDVKVPGFSPILPDGKSAILEDIQEKIVKKVQKIGIPDMGPIQNLNINATIEEKKAALKEVISKHLQKLSVPDLKLPKNGANVNPKPPPVLEILNQLKKAFKMDLPQIALPSTAKISVRGKLKAELEKLDFGEIGADINIEPPPPPDAPNTPDVQEQMDKFLGSVRGGLKKIVRAAHKNITPASMGIITQVTGPVSFMNPYVCRPSSAGISVPGIPGPVALGLAAVLSLSDAAIDRTITLDVLKKAVPSLTPEAFKSGGLKNLVLNMVDSLPALEVPDPSKISIKDMMKDSVKKVVKLQLPSLPDPTKPPQIQVTIPGSLLKTTITSAVNITIDAFDVGTVDFSQLSGVDLKQMIVVFVESSFKPLDDALSPFLSIIGAYQAAKDKTFAEILGLGKVTKDDSIVPTVTKPAMDVAIEVIKAISLVPYPAVAFAPQAFKQLHPVLIADDLPPWERLTLKNFLWVTFLDAWCVQGKKGGGFFENP